MNTKEYRASLLEAYVIKSTVKQQVFNNTAESFLILKKVLKQLEKDYIKVLKGQIPDTNLPQYQERGPFEMEFRIGGDLLLFSMHSNVFEFDNRHPVNKIPYVLDDPLRSYCGMIMIYNFLADSFRYNRMNDLGYLVARIFINKDKHFFVEGKRQSGELVKDFAVDTISPGILREIVETAIEYSISFDLLVPPYEQIKIATVDQMQEKISHSKIATGKRIGFTFRTDDV
ncbi:MAG: hypothetical protein ACOZDD_11065 [Bacteroidota bacterium]